ncbi:hypothetical protein M8997_013850 [Phyllobacterium sp. 21LDTY02-6]|jgi:hypothetical protein|uniref:hypothetical protein n=1 Tax=unclassified Phyllobacterium TaxID=2638441 RepID=UPI0020206666|nr:MULTISPECIES: hypothetical protein [unclassified Phyllobacterium]MCO4318274.1 hypothetical protein [Phyllobacterium sp. 21LDTY02-6]MCX8280269.1 hypothetical protein [Phyllobacterium sp. 0TCS1.6C]MCX8294170.1 hypothetical protein [Phyllobacterium sp. 0TCS1.6A]
MTAVPTTMAASIPASTPTTQTVPMQNMFEHMAGNIHKLPHGASPGNLGKTLVNDLKGFVERTGKFVSRTSEASKAPTQASFANAVQAKAKSEKNDSEQIERVVQSLGTMFDHSIETQMVVRGTTQLTGAATTLTKGQ